ncbi:MAG: nitrite reductase small subunit NirD [Pseudohongiella sp.]|uniref:nitrite reductase small subunit NirD n=1 Tax=Pseudohongiella sp. TaxID=1979412 RepID=UPI0034A082B4
MSTHATARQQNLEWIDICAASDVVANTGVAALVEGKQIAIFNTRAGWYAIDNHDPFSQANVIARGIVGDIKGQLVVASPVYKQHFCLNTGQCLEDDSVALSVYPTNISDDRVQIAIQR